MGNSAEEKIIDLERRVEALEERHAQNRRRIKNNRSGIKTSLALMAFAAIVFGLPIAEFRWQGRDDFSVTRDTASPGLVVIGGLAAAAVLLDGNPTALLKMILGAAKTRGK